MQAGNGDFPGAGDGAARFVSELARGHEPIAAARTQFPLRPALCPGPWGILIRMARSIWTGAISFGLVTVPVKLYSAVSRKTVRFHQLNGPTGM
ncbi:MAG: end-binding protein Ku, partial [Solirubrobacteraceae bacterium]|nr:end-binding protein Ku [Solirubrobacteraceae bacterium]